MFRRGQLDKILATPLVLVLIVVLLAGFLLLTQGFVGKGALSYKENSIDSSALFLSEMLEIQGKQVTVFDAVLGMSSSPPVFSYQEVREGLVTWLRAYQDAGFPVSCLGIATGDGGLLGERSGTGHKNIFVMGTTREAVAAYNVHSAFSVHRSQGMFSLELLRDGKPFFMQSYFGRCVDVS